MLQLYKSRDFGSFFKDTFGFLRMHGKHFFKNYLTVNGIFLLILVAMTYFFYKFYEDVFTSYIVSNNTNALTDYLNENSGTFILYLIIFVIVGITIGVLNYAFVPIYFKLYEKHQGINFSSKEIADELFANAGKLFKYLIASIIIGIPVIIIFGIVCFVLAITIIGLFFIFFPLGLVAFFYHSALMEYLQSDDKGVFECFSYSLKLCFQKFFPTIGALGIFLILASIFQSLFGIIQFVIMMVMGVTSLDDPNTTVNDLETGSILFIIIVSIQIVSYLINYLVSAILQINQAIVYYSLKEDRENINTKSTIDEIGTGSN